MKNLAPTAAVLVAFVGPAQAQPPTTVIADSPYVERVAYESSELTSDDGVRDLRSRVRRAAHRVCELGHPSFIVEYRQRVCYRATLPDALAQVDRAVDGARRGELASAARIVVAVR